MTHRPDTERTQAERPPAPAKAKRGGWLNIVLAGAVLVLVAGGGSAGLWWREQQAAQAAERARANAERAAAVAADLQQAAEHRRKGRLTEAAADLERADGRLTGADLPEQRRLIDEEKATLTRARDDLALADRLDEVRLAQAVRIGVRFDATWADANYRDAFRRGDFDPERTAADEAAKRIQATTVADRIAAALDEWIAAKQALGDRGRERLRAVVDRVDDDPWRRRLRKARDAGDKPALTAMASEPQVAALQPADLVQLGAGLDQVKAFGAAAAVLAEGRRRRPGDFWLNHQLGRELLQLGRADEAARYFSAAVALRPDSQSARLNLGVTLGSVGRTDEAVDEYRSALAADPNNVLVHYNLAVARQQQRRYDEAEQEYKAVIGLQPPMAEAHNNLGVLLKYRGRLDDALAEYRAALAIDPDLALAHCNIGFDLQDQGHLRDGLEELRRGHELAQRGTPRPLPTERWLRDGQALVDRDDLLPLVLSGQAAPADAGQALAFADLCRRPFKHLYAAAAGFYADALAADPTLADDPATSPRYAAATAAALAGVGKGDDAPADAAARARLRDLARAWLRADLDAWTQRLATGGPDDRGLCREALQGWKKDDALDGVRHPVALADFPPSEQDAWMKLWADVDAVLAKANEQLPR